MKKEICVMPCHNKTIVLIIVMRRAVNLSIVHKVAVTVQAVLVEPIVAVVVQAVQVVGVTVTV